MTFTFVLRDLFIESNGRFKCYILKRIELTKIVRTFE